MNGWWGGKLRQFRRHFAPVTAAERASLASLLTPSQLALFDSMHPADRRHGLDVARTLHAAGRRDRDLLLAALFHDAAKGRAVGLWHRVAWSLGERYGSWLWRAAARLPGFAAAFERIRDHPERSAELALAAGCSPVTAAIIRARAEPEQRPLLEALRLADEAN